MYKITNINNQTIAEKVPDLYTASKLAKSYGNCWIISPTGGIVKEYFEKDKEKEAIADLLLGGFSLELGFLSISPYVRRHMVKYQVYCRNYKNLHNEVYENLDEAINKFVELKRWKSY